MRMPDGAEERRLRPDAHRLAPARYDRDPLAPKGLRSAGRLPAGALVVGLHRRPRCASTLCMRWTTIIVTAGLVGCGANAASTGEPTGNADHAEAHPGSHHHAHGHAHHGARPHSRHQHDFSDAEGFSKLFDDPARDAWQQPEEVVLLMEIRPGMTVADLGAGTGYFLPHLAKATGPQGLVLGLDVEPNMVEYMKKRIARERWVGVEARRVPTDAPGVEPGSVDRFLIVDTWHHLADRPAYARRLAKALRPNGSIWIVDFAMGSDFGPPPAMRLPPETILAELRAAGLKAMVVDDATLPNQYVIRAER